MSDTRFLIERSWANAQRHIREVGPLPRNAATYAGQLLEAAKGDARAARDAVPIATGEEGEFYRRVRETLSTVVAEESAELGTHQKTGS